MKINDVLELKCVDMNHEGLGVVKKDDFPLFVSNLLIGESAKIKIVDLRKNYGFGEVLNQSEISNARVKPICNNFLKCGGCDLMHMNYKAQLDFKLNMANATFKRIGHLDFKIKNIIGMENPYRYRNKVQMPIGMKNNKIITGFYKKKSHDIIELNDCYIQPELSNDITKLIKNVANDLKIQPYSEVLKKGCLRHIILRKTYNGEYMVVLVIYDDYKTNINLLKELTTRITTRYNQIKSVILNINKKINNVILGCDYSILYGTDILIEEILGLKFKLSHKAFFQINLLQTERLYSKALEYADIKESDTVLDCYCGVGTISLLAAKKAKKVYGIEVVEEAIVDAIQNSKLNDIKNVEFIVGKAEEEILKFKNQNINIDVMIVDPPRKGLDIKVIEIIKYKKLPKIVYVSCDIATLARDLSLLSDQYEIKDVTLVDMFPQTADVETVVLLSHRKVDDYVEVEINTDDFPITSAELKATYTDIQDYIMKKHGVKVTSLEVAQMKQKYGIIERDNYNKKKDNSKYLQPRCSKEKEEYIIEAFKYYKMI